MESQVIEKVTEIVYLNLEEYSNGENRKKLLDIGFSFSFESAYGGAFYQRRRPELDLIDQWGRTEIICLSPTSDYLK